MVQSVCLMFIAVIVLQFETIVAVFSQKMYIAVFEYDEKLYVS